MSVGHPRSKVIVIETNAYSGNFEREMCAYITGQIGECTVGEEIADRVKEYIKHYDWFEDYITSEPDDRGCYRPCSIWQSGVGKGYKSVAIFVDEFPPKEVIEEVIERAKSFCDNYGRIVARDYYTEDQKNKKLQYLSIKFLEPIYEIKEVSLL